MGGPFGRGRVYPRGCGGAPSSPAPTDRRGGLSPRVRGSLLRGCRRPRRRGSIPAGAGEPAASAPAASWTRVYPRGCGGASTIRTGRDAKSGLSPRVRGSQAAGQRPRPGAGSIPAGAGEPWTASPARRLAWVYPRGCGGATPLRTRVMRREGLSPRVRGSPARNGGRAAGPGSIPAGAGEPLPACRKPLLRGVYPRGCGGATMICWKRYRIKGLSPRVRGSPGLSAAECGVAGSIPAGAGEPLALIAPSATLAGLSPRVRGSPAAGGDAPARQGSIPAGAGEPRLKTAAAATRVYPRGCGGAWNNPRLQARSRGLSPRVRGSHDRIDQCKADEGSIPAGAQSMDAKMQRQGSIPAGAGEPGTTPGCRRDVGVYPRGCGGALPARPCPSPGRGLSPRVRGSP